MRPLSSVRKTREPGTRVERGERVGARVAVVVVSADGDDRHARPEHRELVGEAGVGRAVVSDLEHLDLPQRQGSRHLRLGVAGQEQVDRAVAREQRRCRGDAGSRPVSPRDRARGRGCWSRPSVYVRPDAGRDERHAEPARRRAQRPLVEALARLHRVDHRADVERPQDGRRAADVVAVPVRDDERGEPWRPMPPELPVDVCLGRPGVDEHRALRRLEQDCVALADVEERDAQPCRRRPRRRWVKRPPADREERHERDGGDDGGAAAVRRQRAQSRRRRREQPRRRERPCATTSARMAATRSGGPRTRSTLRRAPAIHESATAAEGITGASTAAARPQPSRTGIAGSASAFAGTVQSGIVPNWSQRIGAVTMPQAAEIPTTSTSQDGTG